MTKATLSRRQAQKQERKFVNDLVVIEDKRQFLKPFPFGLAAFLKSCEPPPTCWEGLSCAIWESERLVPTASKTWFPSTSLARARGGKGIAEWWWTGLVGEAAMAVQQFLKLKEEMNVSPMTCTLFHGISPQFAKKIP